MDNMEQAQKVVTDLEDELESLQGRAAVLTKAREQLSYSARTGDKTAREKLGKTTAEATTIATEIEIVISALVEARKRLGTAEQLEAKAQDEAKALQLQEVAAVFVENLEKMDDACATIAECSTQNKILLSEIHRLGCMVPGHDIVRISTTYALKTMLMQTPVHPEEFSHPPFFLAPGERKSFRALARSWDDNISRQIEHRLPKQRKVA
jgi:hypothetical protein